MNVNQCNLGKGHKLYKQKPTFFLNLHRDTFLIFFFVCSFFPYEYTVRFIAIKVDLKRLLITNCYDRSTIFLSLFNFFRSKI